jgi:signal transduction histidine kinase/CheY-like chemotaxis protein
MRKIDAIEANLFKKEKFKLSVLWGTLTLIIVSMLGIAASYIFTLHQQEIDNKFIGAQAVERMVLSNFEGQILYLDERLEAARKIVKSEADLESISSFELLRNYPFKNTAIRNIVVLDKNSKPIAFSPTLDLPMSFEEAAQIAQNSVFDIPVSTTVIKGNRHLGARVLSIHLETGQYIGAVIGVIDPSWVDELVNDIFKSYGMQLSLMWTNFEITATKNTSKEKNEFNSLYKNGIVNKSVNLDLIARASFNLFESGLFWTRSLLIVIIAVSIGLFCLIAGAMLIQSIYKKQTRVSIREHLSKVDADLHAKFIANMSHELRTPVSGILGACEILNSMGVSAEQEKMLNLISTASAHLINLLNAILDDSKIQANALVISRKFEYVLPIVRNCVELFTPLAQTKGVEIKLNSTIAENTLINIDQLRLIQVLTNLIANAVKFTHQGFVSVNATLSFDSAEKDFGILVFKLKDTGIGIPKEEMGNLFKPFFQVDSSESRSYGGTGLGLSITQKLVELMDGRIQVHSELAKGSEFIVTLPVECKQAQAIVPLLHVQAIKKEERSFTNLRILLADDNEMIRSVYSMLIHSLGCKCILAKDGQQAIDLFKEENFDIILMDCHMPVLDGFEAAAAIRQLESSSMSKPSTPIVALSASLSEQDRLKCEEVGIDEFCSKPLKRKALEDLLIKVCL